jgi:hypothetical protein
MAKALTLRQLAKNYQKQSDNFNRLAKLQNQLASDMPQTNQSAAPELLAANAAWDLAVKYNNLSDAYQASANDANAAADAAGEAP